MNTLLMRCLLAGLLLATVAGRIQAFSVAPLDEVSRVAGFLKRQGLTVREPAAKEPRSIEFAAAGCDRPLQAMTMSISLEAVPYFEAIIGPEYVRNYIYFGRVWRAPDALALRAAWIRHRALSLVGLRRQVMHKTLVFVAAPQGCNAVARIDWRPLWDATVP